MAKKVVTMRNSQTSFDLALQLYGSIDKVFTILNDNDNLDNIHSKAVGQKIEYEEQTLSITQHFATNSITLVTGFPTLGEEDPSNWILATGFWNDEGVWVDNDFWID
jgi:hypothetical protein